MTDDQSTLQERIAIMIIDGKVEPALAEHLARTRPWEKFPRWELPNPQQELFR